MNQFIWPESSFREQVIERLSKKGIYYTHRLSMQYGTSVRALLWRPVPPASGQLPNLKAVLEFPE
jgi:hypothetical protein